MGAGDEGRERRYLVCIGINIYVLCCHTKAKIQLACVGHPVNRW